MRLFIAVKVPIEVQKQLETLQKQISCAKCTLPKEFHLTLKFLGEVSAARVAEINQLMQKIEFCSFEAVLDGIGVFPNEDNLRVVWVGLEPKKQWIELQQKVDDALKQMFEKENRFEPHLTIARVKFIEDNTAFKNGLKKLAVSPLNFAVNEIHLIKSNLTRHGAEYEEIAKINAQDL